MDIVSNEKRSEMMSNIPNKRTTIEKRAHLILIELGYEAEFDHIIESTKPDLVIPQAKVVVQVNGCFWHAHNCYRFQWPEKNAKYWKEHLGQNQRRDAQSLILLRKAGWRVLTIWECALVGKQKRSDSEIRNLITDWFSSVDQYGVIEHDPAED